VAETAEKKTTLELATDLTIAWLSNPNTRASANEVADILRMTHDVVRGLGSPSEQQRQQQQGKLEQEYTPAVSVRKSLASKDHLISMIDGKPYKTLRRHLSGHGLTPKQYRERYNLAPDYPMVAPSYSETRREMAKKIGLGRKPKTTPAASTSPAPSKSVRRRKAPAASAE
jgi:predicted transcriptional regulator